MILCNSVYYVILLLYDFMLFFISLSVPCAVVLFLCVYRIMLNLRSLNISRLGQNTTDEKTWMDRLTYSWDIPTNCPRPSLLDRIYLTEIVI